MPHTGCLEGLADSTGDKLGGRQSFLVDVVEHDLRAGQLLVAEDIAEEVTGEDGAAGPEEHCLGHRSEVTAAGSVDVRSR